MQLQNQVYALSNASNFGVSYSCFGGKKGNVPIVYTLEAVNGKIQIYFHSTVPVKNELTGKTDNIHNKTPMGEIKAVPGSLYIQLNEDLLPNKLSNDDTKFHWEVLVNNALPYWINKASDLVENNRIAPVWLIIAKLIKLTSYDVMTDLLDIYDVSTIKAFTANQWWDTLQLCANEVPSVPQFSNALKSMPAKLPNVIEPRTIPMNYITNLRDMGYNFIDWTKIKDISTLPDNFSQADLESHLINNGYTPKKLTDDEILQLAGIATLPPVK
jgi:hypothetical protein